MTRKTLKIFTLDYIKSRLEYNPISGELIWKNGQRKGRNAGCVTKNKAGNEYRYLSIGLNGVAVNFLCHILCYCIYHNLDEVIEIDHLDGNGLNNRISNLREVTRSVNNKNQRRQKNNTSGIAGISWSKRSGKWRVYSSDPNAQRKQIYLGEYTDFLDACCARKRFENVNGYTMRHGK